MENKTDVSIQENEEYKESVIGTGNFKVCIYNNDNATPSCFVKVPKVILSVRKVEKQ